MVPETNGESLPGLKIPKHLENAEVRVVGEKVPGKIYQTVLFIGETGSGKTSTINSMANFLYGLFVKKSACALNNLQIFLICHFTGVKFDDPGRFCVVNETDLYSILSGPTTDSVTVYNLEAPALNYEYGVTVIDTPGLVLILLRYRSINYCLIHW